MATSLEEIMKNSCPTLKILGVKCSLIKREEILSILSSLLQKEKNISTFFSVNPEIIVESLHNQKLSKILKRGDFNLIDGIGVVLAVFLLYRKDAQRIPGSLLIYDLAELATRKGYHFFLLGGKEKASLKAKERFKRLYPSLKIENYSPPFFSSLSTEENENILKRIRDFRTEILMVAFGAPKQEIWISNNSKKLNEMGVKIVMAIGGTIDYLAGKPKEPPRLIRKIGLEWFYRLLFQPVYRLGRQIRKLPEFTLRLFIEFLRKVKN